VHDRAVPQRPGVAVDLALAIAIAAAVTVAAAAEPVEALQPVQHVLDGADLRDRQGAAQLWKSLFGLSAQSRELYVYQVPAGIEPSIVEVAGRPRAV